MMRIEICEKGRKYSSMFHFSIGQYRCDKQAEHYSNYNKINGANALYTNCRESSR